MQAQATLTGEITDKNDKALAGVSVDFNNGLLQTISNSDGKFSLTYPDTLKERRISFRCFGYKTKTMSVNKGQQTMKVILMDSVYNLGSISVLASRYGHFSDYSAQTVKMSVLDILTNPAAMADIIGNMRVLPGVQNNDNDGRLIIQGGNPEESQIYINDLIVANPYSSSAKNNGVRSRFTPDLFSGTVLQSGGFNAEFGQALSGIVNLNTKEHGQMTAKTDISVSSVYSGLTHIERKSSYACRASVDYTNASLNEKISGSAYDWEKPYQSVSSDFFLTKEFSPDTKITAQFNGSYANGVYSHKNIDGATLKNNLTQSYLYAQMNFYHAIGNHLSLSAASNLVIDKLSGTEVNLNDDRFSTQNIWNHNKLTLQYKAGKIINRTGVEFMLNPYNEVYTLGSDYKQSIQNNLTAVYNDVKVFLSNNFTISAGLRGEYSVLLRKFNFAPRLYAAYCSNVENIFSVAVGDYFQLPMHEYLKISDNLDFTSVRKVTASYGYVRKASKFQVDAYYKKYNKVVAYSRGKFIDNSGNGYGYGGDVFWKSNLAMLEYWLTYSYNNTEKKYDDFSEAVTPSYVSRHSANLMLKYWIPALKSLPAANVFIASGRPYYTNEAPRAKAGETPPHSRLDVSWSYLPVEWIVVNFCCQNVLGRKNIYGYEYSTVTPGVRKAITAARDRFLFVGVFITLSSSKKENQLSVISNL